MVHYIYKQMTKTGCILAILFCFAASFATAQSFTTQAKAAYIYDLTTDTVLLNKQGDVPLPPASMSKLMTLLMTFEALRDGRLRWNEKLPVSKHAMNYGGSTMFLDTTDRVLVEDLVRGIIVLSGNDACAVIAEALSVDGTEFGFATMMTERARALGMMNSTFMNSNGWPHPGHRMSAIDLAILTQYLIKEFPEYYPLFSETEFKFDGRAPSNVTNRNPLLKLGIGADGLKTGYSQSAGYGLVGSAQKAGRRIIFVASGMKSSKERAVEAERIVTWAFRQFSAKNIGKTGDVIGQAEVWMGDQAKVGLTMQDTSQILVPVTGNTDITAKIEYSGPLQAPIKKGDAVGELVISAANLPDRRFQLLAEHDVSEGGILVKMRSALIVLAKRFAG